jgi:DNA-binding CsgD family transcriptional regulator
MIESPWLAQMRASFAAARFSESAALYEASAPDETTGVEAGLLYARAVLKVDAARAVDVLLGLRARAATSAERFAVALYLGVGFARLRDFASADKHFEAARTSADARSLAEAAELANRRARRYLLESRIGDAWRQFDLTLADRSLAGRIRSERLKGAIHGVEERYVEQAESLTRTLGLIGEHLEEFAEAWYASVHEICSLARELPARDTQAIAMREIERCKEWPADFRRRHFQALRALGWCKALSGDSLGCFRYLREANALAETVPDGRAWRTMIMLDRAYFAADAGEHQWAANELAAAEDLARIIEWNQVEPESRAALMLLAEMFAPIDPEKAALYMARFHTLDPMRQVRDATAIDARWIALAQTIRGTVHLARGDAAAAERELKPAFGTFDRIGYEWRAGKAALALAEATGKSRWHLLAAEKLELYPNSWLYRDLKRTAAQASDGEHAQLTPMQQRVFDMICAGLSTDAITDRLGRSRNTIRNHIKVIFKAYEVRSRSALVAKAARSGILG